MSKFKKKPLKKTYFREAMNHFREECDTEKIAFLFVSDDMEWGKTELQKLQKKHKDIFFEGMWFDLQSKESSLIQSKAKASN